MAHLSAPQPDDVHARAEAATHSYTILDGDQSFETQTSIGHGFAQNFGPITSLSEIPASGISTDYLASLFAHNPASPTSTNTSTQNQRQPPAGARANRNPIGPVHDLVGSPSIDTSFSGDEVQLPAEVAVDGYDLRTAVPEAQQEFNELLARIQGYGSSLVARAPTATMLEELPFAIPFLGRQPSLGPPHDARDVAAAARLLQLSAAEVPDREAYALEHQIHEQIEDYAGEDLEGSTELWQVAFFDDFGQNDDHGNFLDQILADWDAQPSLDQLPTSGDAFPSYDWEQWPFAFDGELLLAVAREDPGLRAEQRHLEPRRSMEWEVDSLVLMGAIVVAELEELRSALLSHRRQPQAV
ncbi:hypothetical protein Purlil1_13830 [Purpureocillium lilacinum]|uniref:Uncharacterized protein n=1 Tax=Purpureocillium lilacinum TaxID=33203 RepID=A0ABR0BD14_PURLI|nr:hypothetical protein Purlil1_13830 [Purpureocillium lilacinum]